VATQTVLDPCVIVGLLFVDAGLAASDGALSQLAAAVVAVEAVHPSQVAVVVAPAAEDTPVPPLPGPTFFAVHPDRVADLRRRVGARVALSVPSLYLLAQLPVAVPGEGARVEGTEGGAAEPPRGLKVINNDGLTTLRRGGLSPDGFPGTSQISLSYKGWGGGLCQV
jgi:hypothetical protein